MIYVRFSDQLAVRGIETIGVLDDPSLRMADPYTATPPPPIEGLLSTDSTHWLPTIDHVITKLSLRIHWWQLGARWRHELRWLRGPDRQNFRYPQTKCSASGKMSDWDGLAVGSYP